MTSLLHLLSGTNNHEQKDELILQYKHSAYNHELSSGHRPVPLCQTLQDRPRCLGVSALPNTSGNYSSKHKCNGFQDTYSLWERSQTLGPRHSAQATTCPQGSRMGTLASSSGDGRLSDKWFKQPIRWTAPGTRGNASLLFQTQGGAKGSQKRQHLD